MYTIAVTATTIFFVIFGLAIFPAMIASFIEDKWRSGIRTTLLGYDTQSFSSAFSKEPGSHNSRASGLSLWPYGSQRSVGFGGAISRAFVGWQDYKGRATRSEFWWWYLFQVIVNVASTILVLIAQTVSNESIETLLVIIGGLFSGLILLATFLPFLALSVRRLHDIDRSGWWLLILLLPVAGLVVLIVFYLMPSTKGPNRYGPPSFDSDYRESDIPQKVS